MDSVTIRGKPIKLPKHLSHPGLGSTKSDIARYLLGEGYTVSEVSKAIPAAYSQVHSIWKKLVPSGAAKSSGAGVSVESTRLVNHPHALGVKVPRSTQQAAVKATRAADASAQRILRRERAAEAEGRPAGPKTNPRVGKLRTGGLPRDIPVGECANCGYDLVVRGTPVGYVFTHVNATAEEYIATIQFCQAVPLKLVK